MTLHLTESGTGTPLVLLHAFPVDSRMWQAVRPELSAVTRFITPDQRGLGRSPRGDAEPSLDTAVADVLAMLDRFGLDRVVLGGCSMGGYLAMALLRVAPQRVSRLVLIDSRANADADQQRANRLAMAERVEAEGTRWLADTLLPGLLGATTHARRPELIPVVRQLISAQPPAGIAWALRAMAARPDSRDLLRSVDVPALVVVGEEDQLAPVDAAEEMADLLPRAELVTLPESGHLTALETPADLVTAIRRWLP